MLNVYDNGARIHTPWYSLFPPRSVEKVKASAATPNISSNDQVRESTLPHGTGKASVNHVLEKTQAYQDVEEGTHQRKPVSIAEQIMSSPVHVVFKSETMGNAWARLRQFRIRHMPVVDENNALCGIVSDRDMLKTWAVLNAKADANMHAERIRVGEIMIEKVLAGERTTGIREIAEAMCIRHIGAIPLVNDKREVVGIVTRSDVLKTLMHEVPVEVWT